MQIVATNIFKRYSGPFIIKKLNLTFNSGCVYGILGPNGIGKSTLLRLLTGMETPTMGEVNYLLDTKKIHVDDWYKSISFVAPYIDLPEHLNIEELINLHGAFKNFHAQISPQKLTEIINLPHRKDVPFESLSSGQKQKIKLALGLCTDSPILFIDEPGTNLDEDNYKWFVDLFKKSIDNRIVIIATNEMKDLALIDEEIHLKSK